MPEPGARDHSAGRDEALAPSIATDLRDGRDPEDLADALQSLSDPEAIAQLRAPGLTEAPSAAPFLERVALSARPPVASVAADLLGTVRHVEAANALDRVASTSGDRAVKKAARRSLYRLASQGIKPEKVAETTTATVGSRAATIYRVIASAYDGSGSRAIWFGAERPLGGIYLIAVMLNDLEGLVDVTVRDTTRKRFAELEESRRAQDPTAWVELPHDYAKQLVQEAASVSREAHRPIPPAFVMWSDVIDNPDEPFGQALIYREISAIEVRLHPTLVDESPRLFEQPEIEPWFDPPSATRRWVRQLTESTATRLILTPESPQDRQERIIREAAKELYPPKVLKGLRRRLEETAYIFQRTGREVEARRAVAAAVTIEDLRPLQPLHPFIRALAVRSLMIGVEVERSGAEPARLALAP